MSRKFIIGQLRYLFRTFPLRRSVRHKAFIIVETIRVLVGWLRLRWELRARAAPFFDPRETCVVVLLSHNRPQNMHLLVETALHNSFVTEVIVSNSNREIRIADWIDAYDNRLTLIDELETTQPGHRLVLADRSGAAHFLAIDDDILFSPLQLQEFFACLLGDPEVPHGVTGNLYLPGTISSNGSPFHHVSAKEREVDVLIGAYAFTRCHLDRVFTLAKALGIEKLSGLRNGEDILLSFSGSRPPLIHAIRPFLCASNSLPGVALWKSVDSFWQEREALYQKLRAVRLDMSAPWHDHREVAKPVPDFAAPGTP